METAPNHHEVVCVPNSEQRDYITTALRQQWVALNDSRGVGDYVIHPRVRHIHDDASLRLSLTETAADDRVQQSMHALSIHQRRTAVRGVNITCPEIHTHRVRCRPPLLDRILGPHVERCC